MNLGELKKNIQYHGLRNTIADVALKVTNKIIPLQILKCIKIEKVNPEFLKCEGTYTGLFLDEATLREFARQPVYQLSETFLNKTLAKGDECFGYIADNELAAYGWYSNKPTEIDDPELAFHFSNRYIYMYKGYTHPNHRGKRLHAIGMTKALEAYLARGYKGIVSYVEATNFASLKSCYRMGYTDIGKIYVARVFRKYFHHSEAECQHYNMKIESFSKG